MSTAYDAAFPNLRAILAAKPLIVCCYTDGPYAYSRAEIDQIHAAGCGVLLNHERAANQLLSGVHGGAQAARDAVAAVTALGAPADGTVAIVYSVDVSVSPAQFPTVGAAFDAINQVHAGRYLTGVYGEGALIDYLRNTGRIHVKGWLSASKSYPGYNPASPNVGMYQLVGTDVPGTDKDIITDPANLGIWWPEGLNTNSLPPTPIIQPTNRPPSTTTKGLLMALTEDQLTEMLTEMHAALGRVKQSLSTNPANMGAIASIVKDTRQFAADTRGGVIGIEQALPLIASAIAELPAKITVPAAGGIAPAALQAAVTAAIQPILTDLQALATKTYTFNGSMQ